MSSRNVLIYYAWSRPAECAAPLAVIEDRFPTLFESRRMLYPRYEELSDPDAVDQGVAGFIDHILKRNFVEFAARVAGWTGNPVRLVERVGDDGMTVPLCDALLDGVDTLLVVSFDSLRTRQTPGTAEVAAIARFLDDPDHLAFVCPHHDIGEADFAAHQDVLEHQLADFLHHQDRTIPPRQGFGGYARALLAGLGVPVVNRFGLHPAADADGAPSAIEVDPRADRHRFLDGVATFNLHPHLPQLDRMGIGAQRLDVVARQRIDPRATPHPFTAAGRETFDALLQSRPEVFAGTLLISDATLFSSTAGGIDSLSRLWSNLVTRSRRAA